MLELGGKYVGNQIKLFMFLGKKAHQKMFHHDFIKNRLIIMGPKLITRRLDILVNCLNAKQYFK